ncbi:hypothetical protein EV356DRAFT_233477 [Viridothelium virens]|uniref:AAA+ ATPase domain-containing protein n=1 Tax=Viridothelium virens TaxID=1048519 RepID=A0A6A6H4U5_VIRVR|nr:hypothetical protein EV356DRAFT_233477 [Viridothelium virens]
MSSDENSRSSAMNLTSDDSVDAMTETRPLNGDGKESREKPQEKEVPSDPNSQRHDSSSQEEVENITSHQILKPKANEDPQLLTKPEDAPSGDEKSGKGELNYDKGENDASGDEESELGDLSDGDSVDDLHEALRMKFEDIESRKKLVSKRSKQHRQYLNIMEERVLLLEERCDWLDKRAKKPGFDGDSVDDPSEGKKRALKMTLNPQFWEEFKESSMGESPYVIDVLMGEPKHPDANADEPWRQISLLRYFNMEELREQEQLLKGRSDTEKRSELTKEVENIRGNRMPERIRFNSCGLQHLLRQYFHSSSTSLRVCINPGLIMLRPFKALTHFEDQIRTLQQNLFGILDRLKLTGNTQSSAHTNQGDEHRDESKSEESERHPDPNLPIAMGEEEWSSVLKDLGLFHSDECCKIIAPEWPTDQEARKTFECLLQFMDLYLKPVTSQLRRRDVTKVRFSDLWHLFRAGDEIITSEPTKNQDVLAMRVMRTNGGRRNIHPGVSPSFDSTPLPDPEDRVRPVDKINPFCIHAHYLDFDGTSLTPVRRRFIIYPYAGERAITELDVYPIEYALKVEPQLKNTLIKRGRNFIKYVMSSSLSYCDCKGKELTTKEDLNDKVIVDMKEYYKSHVPPRFTEPEALDMSETSDCTRGLDCTLGADCYHGSTESFIQDQHTDKTAMKDYLNQHQIFKESSEKAQGSPSYWTDDEAALCNYRLFAYKLRSREWVETHVDSLHDVTLTDDGKGFERLVLPAAHKHIIKSQVKEHFRKKQLYTPAAQDDLDLVRGKGQGLIILLHGAPGVGKTCTAETIADLVWKPLYPITCGDLGSTAREVEQNLKQHFTLASRWDCVMLLDEADVFLAKRKTEDLDRNSIVSVFLRIMEYYKGLLFLTTNRIGTFDEAFMSRVHISLFYKNFDKKTTVKVWKTFIAQTEEVIKKNNWTHFELKSEEIKKFAKEHWEENPDARWNGRQIRNAFHTAIAMAEFDAQGESTAGMMGPNQLPSKVVLGRDQFAKIASTVRDFDQYMKETMGASYVQKAGKERIRKSEQRGDTRFGGQSDKAKQSSKQGKKSRPDSEEESSETSSEERSKKKKSSERSKKRAKEYESESSPSDSE